MPATRTYQCPDCDGVFDHFHRKADDPPPEYCPLCGAYVGEEVTKLPNAANLFKSGKRKSADAVYRAMESSSEARAELAGDKALKVTDFKGGKEPYRVPMSSDAQGMEAAARKNSFGADRESIAAYLQSGQTGPGAGSGVTALKTLTTQHGRTAREVTQAGQIASYRGTRR